MHPYTVSSAMINLPAIDETFVIRAQARDIRRGQIAEYLLFPAAVPVLDCNYRSFNSARALIEAAARPCRASARDWP